MSPSAECTTDVYLKLYTTSSLLINALSGKYQPEGHRLVSRNIQGLLCQQARGRIYRVFKFDSLYGHRELFYRAPSPPALYPLKATTAGSVSATHSRA